MPYLERPPTVVVVLDCRRINRAGLGPQGVDQAQRCRRHLSLATALHKKQNSNSRGFCLQGTNVWRMRRQGVSSFRRNTLCNDAAASRGPQKERPTPQDHQLPTVHLGELATESSDAERQSEQHISVI